MNAEKHSVSTAGGERASVLIVTLRIDSVAPARLPRELRAAGFAVTLLAPKEAFATHSRFVDRIGTFPPSPTVPDWIQTFAGAAQAVKPTIVLPAEDLTLRMMMQLVIEPPAALRADLQRALSELVVRSLGDPAHFATSVDRTRLLPFARSLGIRTPPGEPVDDEGGAVRVAESLGYPVMLRPALSLEGAGVARCESAEAVRDAWRRLPTPVGWVPPGGMRAVVERFIDGPSVSYTAAAWQGKVLAGISRQALVVTADGRQDSVSSYRRMPELAEATRKLVAALGISGFLGTQFKLDGSTGGEPYLIDLARRMTPAAHTGRLFGVDLAAALAAAVAGQAWDGASDLEPGPERKLALFPQEWLRNPASRDLRDLPTDTPWDDPDLLTAVFELVRKRRVTPGTQI